MFSAKRQKEKVLRISSCAKVQPNPADSFRDRTQKFTFWIWWLFSSALDLGIGAGPTHPLEQFLGIPPLTQPYDFDAIAHIGL